MKLRHSNKKFYDKWKYKVSVSIKGVHLFRYESISVIKDLILGHDFNSRDYKTRLIENLRSNKSLNLRLIEILENFDKSEWGKRIEANRLDIYTNNQSLYRSLVNDLSEIVYYHCEPRIDIPESEPNKIYCKKLPHNKYQYKVYLRPHKLKCDKSAKESLLSWIDSQKSKISMSESVKDWFIKTDWNWDRRYIWIEDQATLLLLKLRSCEVIGKTYLYQVSDK